MIGLAAFLPLSVLTVDGDLLGSRESFGYIHPRAGSSQTWTEVSEFLPDLVVVDEAFGAETRKVIRAAKAAENNGIRSIQVLQFNSDNRSEGFNRALLFSALATSNAAIIYCHGISPMQNAAGVGLLIGKNDTLKVEEIAALSLHTVSDLALIACSSGRGNPFVGQVTVAHAMAVAGVRTVAFTYWPILQKRARVWQSCF